MKRLTPLILALIVPLLYFGALGCKNSGGPPRAIKGFLDLSKYDLHRKGPLRLEGEWEFYWKKLLSPGDFQKETKPSPDNFQNIPSSWNGVSGKGHKIEGAGYGVYRLRIRLNPAQRRGLALFSLEQGTRFQVWINDRPVGGRGAVEPAPGSSSPDYRPLSLELGDLGEEFTILVQIANHENAKGGFWKPFHLGAREAIQRLRENSLGKNMFLLGCLALVAIYHLGLFWLRRDEKAPLIFALVCFIFALRSLVTEDRFILNIFPDMGFQTLVKLEYLSIYAALPIFLLFLIRVFPEKYPTLINTFIFGASIIFIGLALPFSLDFYSKTLNHFLGLVILSGIYLLQGIFRATLDKTPGALYSLLGFLIFFAAALNDILYNNNYIHTSFLLSYGFLGMILAQAYMLSLQFTKARKESEILAERLHRSNQELNRLQEGLENQIKARTSELETLNDFSRKVNASVSLDEILSQIFTYIEKNFSIDASFLQLYDPIAQKLFFYNTSNSIHITDKRREFLETFDVPLTNNEDSFITKTFRRKRPFYLARTGDNIQNKYDRSVVEALEVTSFLFVPLLVNNEVIALMAFSGFSTKMELSRGDINIIAAFCDQAAGAINSSSLIKQIGQEKEKSEQLLLNILPAEVAEELRTKGAADPVHFDSVTVMFTDFKGFTGVAESMTPRDLVFELDKCFSYFDSVIDRYNLEKLKTIGDAYMCAGGIPVSNQTHMIDCILAALEIQGFMSQMAEIKKEQGLPYWELRLGIHTGPLIAGVIGEKKFAYDVWGDTVNTASRMESSGRPGRINISRNLHKEVQEFFDCEYRGKIVAKNKGEIDMYFVNGIKAELSRLGDGRVPNARFRKLLNRFD